MIDCGPARFAIWRRLPQDVTSVINQLKVLFYELGPPTEILTDNDTAFRSSLFKTSVINQLKVLFYERGPPTEILTDNDTAFWSSLFKTFLDEWRVQLRFHCAYVPSGNGIIERCHRTVKNLAARK